MSVSLYAVFLFVYIVHLHTWYTGMCIYFIFQTMHFSSSKEEATRHFHCSQNKMFRLELFGQVLVVLFQKVGPQASAAFNQL